MEYLGLSSSKPNATKTVNIAPSPAAINSAGQSLKNALKASASVADALNVVSKQLSEASANLRKNAGPISNTVANIAKNSAPATAQAVAPIVGGARAAMLVAMPRSLIAGGARQAVNEAANQLKNLSKAAADGAKAVNQANNTVAKGANYVANNVKNVSPAKINNAVNSANNVLNAGVNGLNAVAENNVAPNVNLKANVTPAHMNALKNAAAGVASTKKLKMNGGAKKRNNKSKKSKKGGFFSGLF